MLAETEGQRYPASSKSQDFNPIFSLVFMLKKWSGIQRVINWALVSFWTYVKPFTFLKWFIIPICDCSVQEFPSFSLPPQSLPLFTILLIIMPCHASPLREKVYFGFITISSSKFRESKTYPKISDSNKYTQIIDFWSNTLYLIKYYTDYNALLSNYILF